MFDTRHSTRDTDSPARTTQQILGQYFTPSWAAEALVDSEFAHLRAGDRVLEAFCGDGAWLCALPPCVEAIGVEIDPFHAERARRLSGRRVIEGDFFKVDYDEIGKVQAIVGNPPFKAAVVEAFLKRAHLHLDFGGQAGLILPAYCLQSSGVVEEMATRFNIRQSMLPRNLFPRIRLPLSFVTFTKERTVGRLFGFLLYKEAQEMRAIDPIWKKAVNDTREPRGLWLPIVQSILAALGGEGALAQIYQGVQSKRPTGNPHWHAKVRQVLQCHPDRFRRTGPGRYALLAAAPA
ncbi:N-6 DNA methylase [Variovorax sp. LT1P1]|uniref:N-6 DNA methylase n=1 Tax=Variovorax sp. LT1P1 TaxID=3443730 RepID=UPI003F481826